MTSKDLTWSTGYTAAVQPLLIAASLAEFALDCAALQQSPNIDDALQRGSAALIAARALTSGASVPTPVIVGLANVELHDDVDRVALAGDAMLIKSSPARLARLGPFGERPPDVQTLLVVNPELQLLEMTSVDRDQPFDPGQLDGVWNRRGSAIRAAFGELDRAADLARYAMLLASPNDQIISAVPAFVYQLNPINNASGQRRLYHVAYPRPRAVITSDLARSIVGWSAQVNVNHPKSLDIGMRRLLSATTTRLDAMDGFIDAVMCWENLFGGANDTALKVCGSLARLLEPDSTAARRQLFAELKKLCTVRSRLVHGATEPDMATAYEHRTRAVAIALDAMRATYAVPGFFDISNSVERSIRMLLGT